MNILITSYAFAPSIGGIETITQLMATKFLDYGHTVKIITSTLADGSWQDEFDVYRRPNALKQLELSMWADVLWQNGISLNYLWPSLLLAKPKVVTLQTALYSNFPGRSTRERLKEFALKFCRVMAISPFVIKGTNVPFDLSGNPFDAKTINSVVKPSQKQKELVFVGRLVSDKGADLLVRAVGNLVAKGRQLTCTVIGDGQERPNLENLIRELHLEKYVGMEGFRKGSELYQLISEHEIMVVPSKWQEPFGIVALEGIACGCVLVASNGGGLPLAVGDCGLTFDNDNLDMLVACLSKLLDDKALCEKLKGNADVHLKKFNPDNQAKHYLDVFSSLINRKPPPLYLPLIEYSED